MSESYKDYQARLDHQVLSRQDPPQVVAHAHLRDVRTYWFAGADKGSFISGADLFFLSDGTMRWTKEKPLENDPQVLPKPEDAYEDRAPWEPPSLNDVKLPDPFVKETFFGPVDSDDTV